LGFKSKLGSSLIKPNPNGGDSRGYSGRIKRAADVMDEQGLGSLLSLLGRKLLSPLIECGSIVFFMRETDGALPTAGEDGQFEVRLASPENLAALLDGCDHTRSEALLRGRFERGDFCFAATHRRGKIAHCRWLSMHRTYIPELARDVVLRPGEAYFYDGYTRREMRRHHVDGAVRCHIFSWMRAHGFKRVYSYACADNFAGIKAARRWQKPVGRLFYIKLRGFGTFVLGKRNVELPMLAAPSGDGVAPRQPAADRRDQSRATRAS
jgi:hypothetical protein